MEYKVRKESQSLMEKTFNKYARRGSVAASQVPEMMKQISLEWAVGTEEFTNMISGRNSIDLEGFNKIALHFLLKQAKHDADQFIHKHEICSADFPDGELPSMT